MSDLHSPPKRDAKLRLALHLERHYAKPIARPDPLQQAAERVLYQVDHLRRLSRYRQHCQARGWHTADLTLATRQGAQLRELQYLLTSIDRTGPQQRIAVTASMIYRDLQALDDEFGNIVIDDDLSSVSVDTDRITLEGVSLGRFRLTIDLASLTSGRTGRDCLDAEALDPNPASCNDDITHPHVQGGQVCLGEGSVLLRAALAEGRLYDAFVVVNQVLHTYNDGSPYVALGRWNGRTCDNCDDVIRQDEDSVCEACSNTLCSSCVHPCADCDYSYCRGCLTAKDDDLLCSSCYDDRVAKEEEEQDEDPQPLTPEETDHVPAIP